MKQENIILAARLDRAEERARAAESALRSSRAKTGTELVRLRRALAQEARTSSALRAQLRHGAAFHHGPDVQNPSGGERGRPEPEGVVSQLRNRIGDLRAQLDESRARQDLERDFMPPSLCRDDEFSAQAPRHGTREPAALSRQLARARKHEFRLKREVSQIYRELALQRDALGRAQADAARMRVSLARANATIRAARSRLIEEGAPTKECIKSFPEEQIEEADEALGGLWPQPSAAPAPTSATAAQATLLSHDAKRALARMGVPVDAVWPLDGAYVDSGSDRDSTASDLDGEQGPHGDSGESSAERLPMASPHAAQRASAAGGARAAPGEEGDPQENPPATPGPLDTARALAARLRHMLRQASDALDASGAEIASAGGGSGAEAGPQWAQWPRTSSPAHELSTAVRDAHTTAGDLMRVRCGMLSLLAAARGDSAARAREADSYRRYCTVQGQRVREAVEIATAALDTASRASTAASGDGSSSADSIPALAAAARETGQASTSARFGPDSGAGDWMGRRGGDSRRRRGTGRGFSAAGALEGRSRRRPYAHEHKERCVACTHTLGGARARVPVPCPLSRLLRARPSLHCPGLRCLSLGTPSPPFFSQAAAGGAAR